MPISMNDPVVFLFVKQEDRELVIGYLDRYIDFIRAEKSVEGGLPIEASYVEYLMEIRRHLAEM